MFGKIFGNDDNEETEESTDLSEADSIQAPQSQEPEQSVNPNMESQQVSESVPDESESESEYATEPVEREIDLAEDEPEEMLDVKKEIKNFDPENPNYSVDFDPKTAETQMDRELMIFSKEGEGPFTGAWPRAMFEQGYKNPEAATWIGYVSSTRTGLREVPVAHNAWFRHAAIFGTTGYGKTTLLKNLMVQWAWDGWGFCFIDPKGDGVTELMQEIPAHRLDDVIWIDPSPTHSDRVVGINFMEPGAVDDPRQFAEEVESIIDDLRNIVKNESYWGPKMDGIMSNIARGMIQSDKPYTLIDMYYILLDEKYRELFVAEVDDPAVQRYTKVISEEMDQSDLDPLLRRLQRMVENRVTREIIAHREATVNLKDAVEQGKIILVKNDIDSGDIKTMVSTGIMRRVWAAIKSRTGTDEDTRTPFFMIIDEFDDVVSEDADVEKMLSKARSMRMSVTLCCQQPSQLPRSIRKSIFGNCDNLLALNPNEPDDASHIMKRFGDYDATDLTNLGRFKMFTRIMVSNSQSEPFLTNTFPDYPPLRTEEAAYNAIEASLKKYGRQRLDPVKAVEDVIIGKEEYGMDENSLLGEGEEGEDGDSSGQMGSAAASAANNDMGARAEEGKEATAEDISEQQILESILAIEIRNPDREYIPLDEVKGEIERRAGDTGYQSISANIFEQLPDRFCTTERHSGEQVVKLKPAGRSRVFSQDTGSAATGGGNDHRYVLKRAYKSFTRAGFIVERPTQGGEALPDAIADLPMDMSASSYQAAQRKMEKLRRDWPDAAKISGGSDLNIEAETTTIEKPKQTLRNLKKALEKERKCIFAIKDTTAKYDYIAKHGETAIKILTDPPCIAGTDDDGRRRFYNQSSKLEVADNVYALRPADSGRHAYWWEDKGGISIYGTDNEHPLAEFANAEETNNPTKQSVPAYYHYDRSNNLFIVTVNEDNGETKTLEYNDKDNFKEDWKPIRPPFVPEYEFPRMPEDDDWMIVVYPDDDKPLPPLHLQYNGYDRNGDLDVTLKPLLSEDEENWNPQALEEYVDDVSKLPDYEQQTISDTDETNDETETDTETDTETRTQSTTRDEPEPESSVTEETEETVEEPIDDDDENETTEPANDTDTQDDDDDEDVPNFFGSNDEIVELEPKKAGEVNKNDDEEDDEVSDADESSDDEETDTDSPPTSNTESQTDNNIEDSSNADTEQEKHNTDSSNNSQETPSTEQEKTGTSETVNVKESKEYEYEKRNPTNTDWLLKTTSPLKKSDYHLIDPQTDRNRAIITGKDTSTKTLTMCDRNVKPPLEETDSNKVDELNVCKNCLQRLQTRQKSQTTGTTREDTQTDEEETDEIENAWDTEFATQQRNTQIDDT